MSEIKITIKQKKQYLKNPDICPFCKSDNITGGEFNAEYNMAFRNVQCNDCKTTWTENFILTGIDYAQK